MFSTGISSVNRAARVLCAAAVFAFLFAPRARAQVVQTYDFDDGTTQGWGPFPPGSPTPTLTNAISPIGPPPGSTDPHALLVTNRSATYMGPSIDLVNAPSLQGKLIAGATYQISAYVLLAAPDTSNPTVTITTKLNSCATPDSGTYRNVATSGSLSDTSKWTQVQGTFSFSDQPGPPATLLLYMQSSSATDSFYVDHVVITEVAPPPNPGDQDNTGISTDFEDGGLDGWSDRLGGPTGGATVVNSTAAAHSGTHSLLTTGRTKNFDGPQISVDKKMYNGSQYNLSAWVLLSPADGTNHVINMSLQTTLNGNMSFPSITPYPGITVAADGQWHQISVHGFNMGPYDPGQAFVYFQTVPPSGNDLTDFYIDDFQVTYVPPVVIQTDIPSIFQTLSPFFPVGAEVDTAADLSGPHAQLLTMHFNSLVSGNDMKWSSVENTQGTFNFTNADNQVGFAVCKGMRVRGHNLVWSTGAQTPSWAFGDGTNSDVNKATVTQNIQEHIQNEVQHFGTLKTLMGEVPKVDTWDVVNEPLDPSQPDCLQHGPFYKVLGKSYIDVALQAARQYAPAGTKLFINDYSTADPNRLACLVQVVNDLKSRGIPIDGVGHEMHNAINYPSPAAMQTAIETVAENFPGMIQEVTELDESVYHTGDLSDYGSNVPPSVLAVQGWLYRAYFDVFRQLSGKLRRVTFWGMADDDTWLDGFPVTRTDYPLPFDHGLQAKLAYWGIIDPTGSHLPGYGMTFSASVTPGIADTRTITITATNGSVGPAYNTLLTGFTLTQISGPPCTPTLLTAPTAALGDIPTSGTANAMFTYSIVGCNPNSQFTVSVPWTSSTYETGTFTTTIDFNRGNGSKGN